MPVRNAGFELVLHEYSDSMKKRLLEYHLENGGLSRYAKFRYFQEKILNTDYNERQVNKWAQHFKEIMLEKLIDHSLLIKDTVTFLEKNADKYNFHIASGSDQTELREIVARLNLSPFFKSVYGSPTAKKELVSKIIHENSYRPDGCCLIGDSRNDYDAARFNSIAFYGYNNDSLRSIGEGYIESFDLLSIDD